MLYGIRLLALPHLLRPHSVGVLGTSRFSAVYPRPIASHLRLSSGSYTLPVVACHHPRRRQQTLQLVEVFPPIHQRSPWAVRLWLQPRPDRAFAPSEVAHGLILGEIARNGPVLQRPLR